MTPISENSVHKWLLDGDPAIRWQVLRDLTDADPSAIENERRKTTEEGWGKAYLDALGHDDTWPTGRWTGSPWVLMHVMDLGLPPDHPRLQAAASSFLLPLLDQPKWQSVDGLMKNMDLCHVGFWLRIGAYFLPQEPRLGVLIDTLERTQMVDGGWNCQIRAKPKTHHSSLHTTFNALEGLRAAADAGILNEKRMASMESRAAEFVLEHRFYKSDKTGQVIKQAFLDLSFPNEWHYTFLRGLDYFRSTPWITDERATDAIHLLAQSRTPGGVWKLGKPIAGKYLFRMEKTGAESRWITLKALRVLAAGGALSAQQKLEARA